MAKLIYENDDGRRVSFEIENETLQDMKDFYDINAWDEILKAFKTIINEAEKEIV